MDRSCRFPLDFHLSHLRLILGCQVVEVLLADVLTHGIRCTLIEQVLFDNIELLFVRTGFYGETGIVQLVVTHLLIILAIDGLASGQRVCYIVIVIIGNRRCSRIECPVLHRLHITIRTLVISRYITLTMIIFINQHV